jgi:hypothetical protein
LSKKIYVIVAETRTAVPSFRLRCPNPRDAFCARGCYESFHLRRCRVCERPLEAKYRKIKPENDGGHIRYVKVEKSSPTCGATDCKRRWRQKDKTGRFSAPKQATGYQGSQKSNLRKETLAAQALFSAIWGPKNATARRIVAGPPLTPNELHCATVSDGSDCQWKGGEYERLEAKNRAALKKHFAELAKQCLIQPHHPPVNMLGGYRFPDAPTIDLSPLPTNDTPMRLDWRPCSPIVPVADDAASPTSSNANRRPFLSHRTAFWKQPNDSRAPRTPGKGNLETNKEAAE